MDLLIAILFIVIPLVISSKKKAGTNQQKGTGPQMQKVLNQMQTTVRQQVQEVWNEQQNSSRQQKWNAQQNVRQPQQAWAGQQARPQQQAWAGQQQARPQQQAWAGQQNARPQQQVWTGQQQARPQQQSWASQQNAGQPQGMWVQQELDLQQMDPQERMRKKKAELQKKYKTTGTAQTAAVNLQKNNSIVDRAKLNNAKLAEDETLKEIEALHGHKETHASEKVQHDAACQALKHDDNAVLAEESLLGSIDDLMAKGYSGDLSFDRDFIGEAMDMIASFTVPDTVPDMVPDAMAKYQNA